MRSFAIHIILLFAISCTTPVKTDAGGDFPYDLLGDRDSLLVTDPGGRTLFSKNPETPLIPASTLKVLTSLVALHYLREDHRFITEFYMDRKNNLKIKGYGDPFLISETLQKIAGELCGKVNAAEAIILDDSYFLKPIDIPGVTDSFEPYDAPNGALCANFNTVSFKREKGGYVSAEPQTPLLPFVLDRIRHFKSKEGRILLSSRQNETTIYFGNLMQYFLWEKGVRTNGKIELGRVDETKDRLILRYISELSLKDVISELLKFSNNFVANQLLLSAGVRAHGAPGTLEKGIDAALSYSRQVLCTETIRIAEGSGISRENRISALDMHRVLNRFKPYRLLMPVNNGEFYKTGTLSNVSTRVGYLEHQPDQVFSFIVFLNTPGKTADGVMKKLHARLH